MMIMKKRNDIFSYWKKKVLSCAAAGTMAVVMAGSVPMTAMAEPVSEQISGDTIEYGQIKEWIRQYNPLIKSANESYYILAEESMKVAEQLRDEANDLYEEAKDLEKVGTPEAKEAAKYLRQNVKELRKYAKKQQDSSENMDKDFTSGRKQLNHTEDTMTYNAQMLMNTYWQLQSQRKVVAKSVEAAQAAVDASQAMAAQGMVVESGLLASANGLGSAQASLTALDAGIEKVKRNIYMLTGQGYASGTGIGEVPSSDMSRLTGIDLDQDCISAIGNNYELITKRHTELEVKTNKKDKSRLRDIEESEAKMEITIRGLYQDMIGKKASYDAAKASYDSALITWNGAQIQNQQGMLSRAQYLQQEAAFLSAESAYEVADLELFQAMETYDWAVKGLVVADDGQ